METLIYQQHPIVEFATNRFINVPVILQYEDTPLIQVVREVSAGFTTEIPIYHSDGTYLAKVVGSQIYETEEGKKAGITLLHPAGLTVCQMGGKTLFEIKRLGAAALKTQAELYTPDGLFVMASDKGLAEYSFGQDKKPLQIGELTMMGNTFSGCRIGIHLRKNGGVGIGVF